MFTTSSGNYLLHIKEVIYIMAEDLHYNGSFCYICNFFKEIFDYYMKIHPDEKTKSFYSLLVKELNNFAEGRECEYLIFSFDYRVEYDISEYSFTEFIICSDAITVYDGGSIYDPAVGGDTYTNWTYNLYSNGEDSGECVYEGSYGVFGLEVFEALDTYQFIDFINIGATLNIEEAPEEYYSPHEE